MGLKRKAFLAYFLLSIARKWYLPHAGYDKNFTTSGTVGFTEILHILRSWLALVVPWTSSSIIFSVTRLIMVPVKLTHLYKTVVLKSKTDRSNCYQGVIKGKVKTVLVWLTGCRLCRTWISEDWPLLLLISSSKLDQRLLIDFFFHIETHSDKYQHLQRLWNSPR